MDGDIFAVRYKTTIATLCDPQPVNRETCLSRELLVELGGRGIGGDGAFVGELSDWFTFGGYQYD